MNKAQKTLEGFHARRAERSQLNSVFEELAEVLSPARVGFTSKRAAGRRDNEHIFDTTPLVAKRGLVNALGAMLRPKSSAPGKWFDLVPEDEDLLDDREVKAWVDFAEDRLWRALYNPDAGFISTAGEVDDDLVTFGTGVGYAGLRPDRSGFLFRSFHLRHTFLETDSYNQTNAIYIAEDLTPRQAAERWGENNLGQKTRERLRSSSKEEQGRKSCFIWHVYPRFERDPRVGGNRNMPFASMVVDEDSEHIVEEEGYEEFPFFVPRWDTRSGEVYGRGPGIMALPDVLSLNQMGKTMLRALHRAVDPPWLLPSDSMMNAPQMRPGGISYYNARAIRNLGLSQPFQQMESRANIPWGLNAQQASREQIMAVFFRNVLNLPVDAPEMTATEVIQRREEFVREIGAVFGRLETDYTNPLIERCFNIMLRKGAFGTPDTIPAALRGSRITFRFASPIEKAKRQIEEVSVSQAMDRVLAVGQVRPEVMDRFNWDEYAQFIARSADIPQEMVQDDEAVRQASEQRRAMMQKEEAMQTMERGGNIARSLPDEAVNQALAGLAGGQGAA